MNRPKRAWSIRPHRPEVPQQLIRQYTYAYATVDPLRGSLQSLVLPQMTAECMTLFLKEVARRYRGEYVLIFCDQAACHQAKGLDLPAHIELESLPPYSPQLNPVEHLWDDMREKFFPNVVYDSMEALEEQLCKALKTMKKKRSYTQSLCGFSWIVNCILNAN